MREKSLLISNFLFILTLNYFFCIFQISPLFHGSFLSYIPEPPFWLPTLVYLSLYRKAFEGVISVYLIVYSIAPITIQSTGSLLFSSLLLFSFCQILKIRFFWPGVKYFMAVCSIATLVFHFSETATHFIFDDFYPSVTQALSWFIEAALVSGVGFVSYYTLGQIDRLTHKTPLTELGQEVA